MTTDNKIILKGVRDLPPIICPSKNSSKKVTVNEKLIQDSNLKGFNNNVGTATNKATSIRNLMSSFRYDSEEYKELEKREMSVQRIQQEIIDAVKNSEKPEQIPKQWYVASENIINEEDDEYIIARKELNMKVLANKKPYFFTYIYPNLKKQVKEYEENFNNNCMRKTGKKINDEELADSSELRNYIKRYPVDTSESIVNQICWKFEKEFDHYFQKKENKRIFDCSLLKYNIDIDEKTRSQNQKIINKCMTDYKKVTKKFYSDMRKNKNNDKDFIVQQKNDILNALKNDVNSKFKDKKQMLNAIIELTYEKNDNYNFAWNVCGDEIIKCLLNKNENKIKYYEHDDNGIIEFSGDRFTMKIKDYKGEI